jgi:catechol 2,3-dioxygenase-like lactoylglutathione lyase family enzyme
MGFDVDGLMDQYDRGVINRRQLVTGLAGLIGAVITGRESTLALEAATTPAISSARSINHVHINVSDLKRSEDFYAAALGATVRERGEGITTMTLPGATSQVGCWISLTSVTSRIGGAESDTPPKAGTYNHIGIGVDLKDTNRIAADVRKMFPDLKAPQAGRTDQMNVYDPDGTRVQLMRLDHDGYVASEKVPDGRGGTKDVAKYKAGEHV